MSKKAQLLPSSSDESDSEPTQSTSETSKLTKKPTKDSVELNINKSYAEHYDHFREKEVYERLKAKYGQQEADSRMKGIAEGEEELSSSSSEEEDNIKLDEALEKDFFKTLAALKAKDPRIYDGKTDFFQHSRINRDEEQKTPKEPKAPKERPVTLGDLERKVMLEKNGVFEEEEDERLLEQSNSMGYYEEMNAIKADLRKNMADEEEAGDEGTDDLLRPKSKSESELRSEEDDYKLWLAGRKHDLKDKKTKKELKSIREFWNKDNLDEDEKFLKNYILNKGYIDHDEDEHDEFNNDDFNDEEAELEEAENFEHKYNYRFEEPDQEFIKRYPRTMQDSLRRTDSKRKEKRAAVAERKRAEKEQRREELNHLKALKRKEIMAKIEKLKKVAGHDLNLDCDDLDEDFDPVKHDQRMRAVFDQNYEENDVDSKKPGLSDIEDSDIENELQEENWDKWLKNEHNEDGSQIDEDQEDSNENDGDDNESRKKSKNDRSKAESRASILESTSNARSSKGKKRSRFAQILEQSRPLFNPEQQESFDKYLDEYYKLDYEDIIGDLPCRFKYREVFANDFGLSTAEVLSAPDRELNAWCSLKKAVQYRSEEQEKKDNNVYRSKANNVGLKQRILPSLFRQEEEKEETSRKGKKSKKERKRRKREALNEENHGHKEDEKNNDDEPKKKKKKKEKDVNKEEDDMEAETSSKNVGTKESAKKKKKKKKNEDSNEKDTTQKEKKMEDKEKKSKEIEDKKLDDFKPKKSFKSRKKDMKQLARAKKERVNNELRMSDDRMKAYGLNPSQFKRKHKKKMFRAKQQQQQ